jgi:hypothetical protein
VSAAAAVANGAADVRRRVRLLVPSPPQPYRGRPSLYLFPGFVARVLICWGFVPIAEGPGQGDSVQAGCQDRHQGGGARALHLQGPFSDSPLLLLSLFDSFPSLVRIACSSCSNPGLHVLSSLGYPPTVPTRYLFIPLVNFRGHCATQCLRQVAYCLEGIFGKDGYCTTNLFIYCPLLEVLLLLCTAMTVILFECLDVGNPLTWLLLCRSRT